LWRSLDAFVMSLGIAMETLNLSSGQIQNGVQKPFDGQPSSILSVDIGGSKIKILATGHGEPRKTRSGKTLTPTRMVNAVRALASGWDYQAVSIGYPGVVGRSGPCSEPGNLGSGWVAFNFAAAFGLPVRIINDAVMQALGSYEGGRMLFVGLGTGLGSALIADHVIVPLELGQLRYGSGETLGDVLGDRGLKRYGLKFWRRVVEEVTSVFMSAFLADYVVLGGGNSKKLKQPPSGARLGHNLTAFRGGFRLWHLEDVQTLLTNEPNLNSSQSQHFNQWRLI
jgi:polyphosphate glucokinase